ncbi:MAG: aminotransferase class V-fold PLP-dependent enzyme [Luteitalea sp.]|nr:aminotransferase class V-fold PLP-dependent enzyme [Luteitalea sp.]
MVDEGTSTGVLNPVQALAAIAREDRALPLAGRVTSFGRHVVDVEGWGVDACCR